MNVSLEDLQRKAAAKPTAPSLIDLAIGAPAQGMNLPTKAEAKPEPPWLPKQTEPAPKLVPENTANLKAITGLDAAPKAVSKGAPPEEWMKDFLAPKPKQQPERELVYTLLIEGPLDIEAAQKSFDLADRDYQKRLVQLSIEALSAPMFPGKTPDAGMRAASNDTERDLAIARHTQTDDTLIRMALNREAALRGLQAQRNKFEAAKLLASLFTSETRS